MNWIIERCVSIEKKCSFFSATDTIFYASFRQDFKKKEFLFMIELKTPIRSILLKLFRFVNFSINSLKMIVAYLDEEGWLKFVMTVHISSAFKFGRILVISLIF